jgi:hypothetical protein
VKRPIEDFMGGGVVGQDNVEAPVRAEPHPTFPPRPALRRQPPRIPEEHEGDPHLRRFGLDDNNHRAMIARRVPISRSIQIRMRLIDLRQEGLVSQYIINPIVGIT